MQRAIRCALMRGGTSRGPLFLHSDIPPLQTHRPQVEKILLSALTPLVDSLAGGPSVTTKTAIIQPSVLADADVDMHFAQIDAVQRTVDWTPLCGNMLSAVGPFALERGLIKPSANSDTTDLVIHNVSTNALIDARICTPDGQLTYEGDCMISGVEGSGAPIDLKFRNIAGAKTGKVLPTNSVYDIIDDIKISCVDVATPIMFVRANDMGKTGHETESKLSADKEMMERLLDMRTKARAKMGMSKDPKSVLPKVVLVAQPTTENGHLSARYFTPWACHPSYAVGGAICTAAAAAMPGSVVHDVVKKDDRFFGTVDIEHPSGLITATLNATLDQEGNLIVNSGGCVRTARKIVDGELFVPPDLWEGQ